MAKVTGGIYIPHLKNLVVKPALNYISSGDTTKSVGIIATNQAINLVTGTIISESYMRVTSGLWTMLQQHPSGIAKGIGDIETASYNDLWERLILKNSRITLYKERLLDIAGHMFAYKDYPPAETMISNLGYAAAMVRMFYFLRDTGSIPNSNNAQDLANYHKKYYNTPLGKADPVANKDRFQQAIDA